MKYCCVFSVSLLVKAIERGFVCWDGPTELTWVAGFPHHPSNTNRARRRLTNVLTTTLNHHVGSIGKSLSFTHTFINSRFNLKN